MKSLIIAVLLLVSASTAEAGLLFRSRSVAFSKSVVRGSAGNCRVVAGVRVCR